jgi:hypothetical protein
MAGLTPRKSIDLVYMLKIIIKFSIKEKNNNGKNIFLEKRIQTTEIINSIITNQTLILNSNVESGPKNISFQQPPQKIYLAEIIFELIFISLIFPNLL